MHTLGYYVIQIMSSVHLERMDWHTVRANEESEKE